MGENTNVTAQFNVPAETSKDTSTPSTSGELATTLGGINTEKPSYFEKVNSLSVIDENKLAELQQADLVLVYTDNNKYIAMSEELKKLVKIHGGKVYCIEISKNTKELNDNENKLLKKILDTCRLMTDEEINIMLRNYLSKLRYHCLIDDNEIKSSDQFDYERYHKDKYIRIFEKITKELEDKFKEKGIDTVYILISEKYLSGGIFYLGLDHSCMYQNKNGDIYFDWGIGPLSEEEEILDKIDDFKRFWIAMFPNLKVEFIENANCYDFSRYTSEGIILDSQLEQPHHKYSKNIVDDYIRETTDLNELKTEGAVLIGDSFGYFKLFSGKKISYYENRYRPEGGIENFIDLEQEEAKYYGKILAEEIMTKAFGLENINANNVEGGGSSKDKIESTSDNLLGALNTEQQIFDDNHFTKLLNNLEKSDCSDPERENFLNDMGKFNKLGIGSFNKLLLFCSYYNRKIDIDLLTKFSDMTYKELIRSVNCVDLEISYGRIPSKSLEKYLDTINCPYNDEAFNDFWNNSSYEPENIFGISKRHDLSVKNLNRGYYRYNTIHFRNIVKLKEPIRPFEIDYDKLKLFLKMFRQEEINENTILAIIGDCGRTDACTFAVVPQILKEYKLDYYKFCEYFFLDKEANKYDFGKIKEYREYFERNNISSYIPNDLEDKLKECESLTKMEPKDIIEYCENYEIIGGENIEYPIKKKFIIMFNPIDKKLSCVLGSVKALHRDLGGFGNIILGGGYFKTVTQGSYMLKGYSEEFGGFYGYENWLSKIISSKLGLSYEGYGGNNNKEYGGNNNKEYGIVNIEEEYELLSRYYERMGYGKYHIPHP